MVEKGRKKTKQRGERKAIRGVHRQPRRKEGVSCEISKMPLPLFIYLFLIFFVPS